MIKCNPKTQDGDRVYIYHFDERNFCARGIEVIFAEVHHSISIDGEDADELLIYINLPIACVLHRVYDCLSL